MKAMIETRLAYIENEMALLRSEITAIKQEERVKVARHNKLVDQAEILRSLLAELKEEEDEGHSEVDQPEAVCNVNHADSVNGHHEGECQFADAVDR